MSRQVLIDGNNLLHASHAQAVGRHIGRETLVRWIERWAEKQSDEVIVVFDGPPPREGRTQQLESARISVRFAAPKSADDVLVDLIRSSAAPSTVRLVSSDTAIQYEARSRRSQVIGSTDFVESLLASLRDHDVRGRTPTKDSGANCPEKHPGGTDLSAAEWVRLFSDSTGVKADATADPPDTRNEKQ